MIELRSKLITTINFIITISILSVSSIISIYSIMYHEKSFNKQVEIIQNDYVKSQKKIISYWVKRVVAEIDNQILNIEEHIEEITRNRVYNACSIAENLYKENVNIKPTSEIKKMIIDALRPLKFEDNLGYYFVIDNKGTVILNSLMPELERQNLLSVRDSNDTYFIKDIIKICTTNKEGYSEYFWNKPNSVGNNYRKLSYVKYFEAYDWIIGTGLYFADVEDNVKKDLLKDISTIRFGQEGYIFINSLDGYSLVANGKLIHGKKKLWDVFNKDAEKTKELYQKEYEAAIKPEGDYIYYNISKLGSSEESSKASFIYGIPRFNWLVGAGVYLDDIDKEVNNLQKIFKDELTVHIRNSIITTLIIVLIFLLLFSYIGRKLNKDFILFTDFFRLASISDAKINLKKIRFEELYLLAEKANEMQHEKMETQEELKESESKFRLLAENSKDMIFKMDLLKGTYDYVSPASIDIMGYAPKELMDNPLHIKNSIHPDWQEYFNEKLANLQIGNIEDTFEYQIVNKLGENIWIHQKNNIIRDDKGNPLYLVGRLSDETERKQIEDQLRHKYRMDAIGQVAGGIAHDFNNILGGIMNAAQVLQSPKRNIDEKGKQMADLIRTSALRASDLTAKLTSFSRRRTISMRAVDINKLIDDSYGLFRESINNNIDIIVQKKASTSFVMADASEIHSLIFNLVINASHAIDSHGKIEITTKNTEVGKDECKSSDFNIHPGKYIEIEVKDNGSGIKDDLLEKIFEPFFSTKEQGKGSGLGLSTVYGIVLDHHGSITVESKLGVGTSFYIKLLSMTPPAKSH